MRKKKLVEMKMHPQLAHGFKREPLHLRRSKTIALVVRTFEIFLHSPFVIYRSKNEKMNHAPRQFE
jgi:hypothetical protein